MKRIKAKKISLKIELESLIAFLLALSPVLGIYETGVPGVSFGELVLVLACILSLGVKGTKSNVESIIIFAVYSILVTGVMTILLPHTDLYEVIKETASFVIYIVIVIVIASRIDVRILMGSFVHIAIIAAVFLIVQYIVYQVVGTWIPGLIPGVMTSAGLNSTEIIRGYSRPCSFFLEPSHFSQYLAFPLAYILFKEKKQYSDYITLIIFFVSIFMNFTGNGVLIVAVVMGLYVLNNLNSTNLKRFIKGVYLALLAILAVLFILSQTSIGKEIILRITSGEILGKNETIYGNSGYIRAVRGYVVFGKFDFINKLLGVGFGNYEVYATRKAYYELSSKTMFTFSYLNGIQYYLASTGVIGLILYLRAFFHNYRSSDSFKKTLSILFFAMSSIAAFINGPIWAIFIIIMYSTKYDHGEESRYVTAC